MSALLLFVALVPNILLLSSATDDCQCNANERYVKCPALVPGPKSCSQLGLPQPQVNVGPDSKCPGRPGCLCIEGYLRNDKGVCIPKKDCRTNTTPCTTQTSTSTSGSSSNAHNSSSSSSSSSSISSNSNSNSSHNSSGNRSTRSSSGTQSRSSSSSQSSSNNSQSSGNKSQSSSSASSQSSSSSSSHSSRSNNNNHSNSNGGSDNNDEGCNDDNTPRCGADEVYSDCINGGCYTARKCSEKGQPKKCVHPKTCIKGCLCKKGYLRNDAGKCVPENKCDESHKCTGVNEVYDKCLVTCPPQSCNVDGKLIKCAPSPSPGDPKCIKGCRCKDGHFRNDHDVCVPEDKCTDERCDNRPHEWFDSCPYKCSPRTCASLNRAYVCLPQNYPPCQGNCTCRKGYYRNSIGECLTEENCLKCNGPNEYFSCGGACDNVCATLDQQSKNNCPIINIKCNEQCYCEDGYARNSSNICIPIDECKAQPQQCGVNEEFSTCTQAVCRNQDCTQKGAPVACPIVVDGSCIEGCVCKSGYLRGRNGTCLPEEQCDTTCTGINEVYTHCANGGCFGARKCSEKGIPEKCVLIEQGCVGDCICKDGYLRNKDNVCIPENQCPSNSSSRCGKYEYYSSCANGGCFGARKCSEKGAPIKCVKLREGACKEGCLCQDGYLRNKKGICVPENQCPLVCNGQNEFYECGGACDNVCATLSTQNRTNCPILNIRCNDKCYCEDGYARDNNNRCVPYDQCPKKTSCNDDPNAHSGCGENCGRTCGTYKNANNGDVKCNGLCKENGCDCNDGYVLDEVTGKCVLPEKCTLQCNGPNEFYACGGACDNVCATLSQQNQTICPIINIKCNDMCYCDDGYARDNNNVCVPYDKCPPTCKGQNEIYSSCANGGCFGARKCSEIGKPELCIDLVKNGCKGDCICEEGYMRNQDDICIPENQCPSNTTYCTGPYEYFSNCTNGGCYGARLCSEKGASVKCVLITKGGCESGCLCQNGYLKDYKGECVRETKCPAPPTCKGDVNAHDGCGNHCGRSCSTYKNAAVILCPYVCYTDACDCNYGYVFDDVTKKCVLPYDCTPTCKGDPKAKPGCGVNCGRTCDTYDKEPGSYACIQSCDPEGCDCIDGYVLDGNTGQCVLPEKCSPTCKVNEEFSTCTQAVCRLQECTEKGKSVSCPRVAEGYCNQGCVCKENYLRNKNGTCIPENQCESQCPDGETYNTCPPQKCDAENCPKTRDSPTACRSTRNCGEPRCMCGFNQKRDRKTGKCIPISQCPSFACNGPNEEYNSCPPTCPGQNCSDYINKSTCPKYRIGIVVPCEPACRCKNGYYRDSRGSCIAAKKCKIATNDDDNCSNDKGNNGSGKDRENNTECNSQTNSTDADAEKRFADASSVLSAKFLKFLTDLDDSSFITSASSTTVPLAELFLGSSSGESQNQLKNVLGFSTKEEARTVFRTWLNGFKAQENIDINLATKIYIKEDLALKSNFAQDVKDTFDAAPENIDFSNSQQAADTMNQWVEDNTNNRIQNLVSPEIVTPDSRLFLLNAIYFKGNWKSPFNENITEKMDFYIKDNKTNQVDIMYQEARFNYTTSDALDCQALKMSYENDDYSFLVLLPNKQDGLSALVDALQDVQNLDDVVKSLASQRVKVWLPRFELESKIDLSKIFESVGITLIFDDQNSGLTEMLESSEALAVTAATQKAFIKVDEKGSEAAAANVIGVGTTSVTLYPEFKATHPFVYFIIKGLNQVLFSGVYRNPQ